MSEIQGGRWQDYLRRMFSLKNMAPHSISDELIGTVAVIPSRPEDALLRRDKLYHATKTSTKAAANYGHVNMRNESTNQIVIIEEIIAYNPDGPSPVQMRMGNTAIGTSGVTVGGRDTRLGLTLAARLQAGQIRFGHEAATSGTLVQQLLAENVGTRAMVRFGCPIILAPSHAAIIWNSKVNETVQVTFLWREREIEGGELF